MDNRLANTMKNNNVFITTNINEETTNELIMQLTQWINGLQFNDKPTKIYTPYEIIPKEIDTLNVYINSYGGQSSLMKSILFWFNMASAKNVIIKTYNMARADSCASMIAVSGTPGYRYMAENAQNLIHYGNSRYNITHPQEKNFIINDFNHEENLTRKIYLDNTKLTDKELTKYYNAEGAGQLSAQQCLEKGICDWILTTDGRFVNNVKELKSNQR